MDKLNPHILTEEEKQKIVAFLLKHAPNLKCPACGNGEMNLAEHLVSPVIVSPSGDTMLGGQNYPMAMVFCSKCYHASYFAAVPMGVMRPKKTKEIKEQKEAENG